MAEKNSDPRLLETEPIPKLLLQYAVPAIITTLSTSLYNLIDRIFIGQGAGAMAISGLALSLPIMNFLQAFGTLVGVGASTRISIVLGMHDRKWAENILGNALILTLTFFILLCASGLLFLEPLLRAFGGSENTIPYAASYMKIIIPTSILSNLSYSFCNIIRASGAPRKSMTIILIGVGANLILDPILIFVFKMGIQGAAIATAVSMGITALLTMRYFFKKSSYLHFTLEALRPKLRIIRNILSIGVAPFLINLASSLVTVVLNNRLYATGGDLAVGANGIINSYAILFVMFVIGLCQGMQPIAGYNYGAKRIDRSKSVFLLAVRVGTMITCLGFVMMEVFPTLAAKAFTSDADLIGITRSGLRLVFLLFPFVGFQIVTTNFFQALGKVHLSIFLSLTRQVLFLIPSLLLCSHFWGLNGVWAATPVADCLAIIVTALILRHQLRKL